jgi:hypothetical protein
MYSGVFLYNGASYCGSCLTKVKEEEKQNSHKGKKHGKKEKD